jgi:hypothetical protein
MLAPSTLETTRLVMRPLRQGDAPSIQAAVSVREIAETMISMPHPYPEGEALQYIQRKIAAFEAGHYSPWQAFERVFANGETETRYIQAIIFGRRFEWRYWTLTSDPALLPASSTWMVMSHLSLE